MVKVKNTSNADKIISISIIIMKGEQTIGTDSVQMVQKGDIIEYSYIRQICDNFLKKLSIFYETNIYMADLTTRGKMIMIQPSFQLSVRQVILNMQASLILIVKSSIEELKYQFEMQVQQLKDEIVALRQVISQFQKPLKDNLELIRKNSFSPMPLLMHAHSQIERKIQNIEIDIGILFSEPLSDQYGKPTLPAVDFRSEISRLNVALQSSYKQSIIIRSQIATFQSLKNIVKLCKPKILHVVCHGNSDGFLQFQDDSRNTLGLLKYLKPEDVKNLFQNNNSILPELVFSVGKAFYDLGVSDVICVNSSDPISDEAAMNFSENFYRKIFKGYSISEAYNSKDELSQVGLCCCGHSKTLEPHRQNCRWRLMQIKLPNAHRDYHVPSTKCECQKRNINRHKVDCEWARKVLFQINQDFRIPIEGTKPEQFRFPQILAEFPDYFDKQKRQLIICCCPVKGRKPHAESNKFKLFSKNQAKVLIPISQNRTPQIDDITQASLLYAHEKSKAIFGRQKQLFQFLKMFRQINFMAIFGKSGVGLTTFSVKVSTYMIQRRVFAYFFFVDLYDIKDETVFRYKFNQVTNFQYNGKQMSSACVRDRTLLLFDNCDDFINKNPNQFYSQIQNLMKLIPKCKIIITFKQQTEKLFDQKKILCKKFELPLFQARFAIAFLINKMKDKTDISVGYQEFKKLVSQYDVLRIPKVVESLSQSFSINQKRVTYQQIQNNVQGIKLSDTNKLTESVLSQLRERSLQAYQFLVFVSQFSDGITFQDINMFSAYYRKNMLIALPVQKNWQEHYMILFQQQSQPLKEVKQKSPGQIDLPSPTFNTILSQPETIRHSSFHDRPNLNKNQSGTENSKSEVDELDKISSQSYFIDKNGKGRFIVKRFIRDFIWKKHQNSITNQMKFLYVAYFSVILEMLFAILKQMHYFHQQITTYSAISNSGIFCFSTTLEDSYETKGKDLTKSAKFAKEVMNDLQYIFIKNEHLQDKMKKADPSTFIMNHRHDFLKIYDNKWSDVYDYLKSKGKGEEKIFTIMLENLMIYIPTALKIANAEDELLRYVIKGSFKQLKRLTEISKPSRNLILQLKLCMIEVGINLANKSQVQQTISKGKKLINESRMNIKDSSKEFEQILTIFTEQCFLLDLLQDQQNFKIKSSNQLSLIISKMQYFQKTIDNVSIDPLIKSKQGLIISLMFTKYMGKKPMDLQIALKSFNTDNILSNLKDIAEGCLTNFEQLQCIKLKLKCKLCLIQINLHENQFNQDANSFNLFKQIDQSEQIYFNPENRLRGFTQFDEKIKQLKQKIKQKMWKSASKRLIFMKAYPLAAKDYPIVKNLIRKKNNFRQSIQRILAQPSKSKNDQKGKGMASPISKSKQHRLVAQEQKRPLSLDVSTKYEILTKQRIILEAKAKCSIMFITVDVRRHNDKLYFIGENQYMEQDLIEINDELISQLNIDNVLILVLSGVNTSKAVMKILQRSSNPPVIISLNTSYPEDIHDQDYNHDLDSNLILQIIKRQNQIKEAELVYTKHFIKRISQSIIQFNQEIRIIHEQAKKKLEETGCKSVKAIFEMKNCKTNVHLQYKEGYCRDLSPGYERNHNIDHKTSQNTILIRRWKKMIEFFKSIYEMKQNIYVDQSFNPQMGKKKYLSIAPEDKEPQASIINIYGETGCGKTYFIKEIAKILVQRQCYDFGVFLFDGKKIQKSFNGDFQAYIKKQASAYRMPVIEDFQKLLSNKTILIVDDFHIIKPRINARMKIFMEKIINKKVNLVLVSISELKLDYFPHMKKIKLQSLDSFETEVLAYSILDINNSQQLKRYAQAKAQKKQNKIIQVKEILQISDKFLYKQRKHKKSTLSPNQHFEATYETTSEQVDPLYMKKINTTTD